MPVAGPEFDAIGYFPVSVPRIFSILSQSTELKMRIIFTLIYDKIMMGETK
jgi:hypothetical protein